MEWIDWERVWSIHIINQKETQTFYKVMKRRRNSQTIRTDTPLTHFFMKIPNFFFIITNTHTHTHTHTHTNKKKEDILFSKKNNKLRLVRIWCLFCQWMKYCWSYGFINSKYVVFLIRWFILLSLIRRFQNYWIQRRLWITIFRMHSNVHSTIAKFQFDC